MDFPIPRPVMIAGSSCSKEFPAVFARYQTSLSSLCQISSRKITCEMENLPDTVKPVTISYSELLDRDNDLSAKIEEGFGPKGLGIISVSNSNIISCLHEEIPNRFSRARGALNRWRTWRMKKVPEFSLLRGNLLHLAPKLANFPGKVKEELEDPESRYSFGWSHGKEKLESGKMDILKGSFYANPIMDVPTTEASLIQRYPSYCRPNKWPSYALPELEVAFKSLGKLMLDVGLMLAYHCDRYVCKQMTMCDNEGLQQILQRSRCHKGRLLYYFPKQQSECTQDVDAISSWCGWHTDHGSLTGLTCGMFLRDGVEITCPDSAAGLYIKTRTDQIVKVVFGVDDIAYQIGETTEILFRGHLCATPHCVQAPKGEKALGVERVTFALFMQPDWDEMLRFPEEIKLHQEFISPNGTLTFGNYSEQLLNKYYHQQP